MPVSETEAKILEALTFDFTSSKTSKTALAKALGLSRPTVVNRLRSMRERGVLRCFSAVVNPSALPLRTFFLEVKTNPVEPALVDRLKEVPGLREIDGLLGEYSLWVKVVTRQEVFGRVLSLADQIVGASLFQRYRIVDALFTLKEHGEILDEPSERGQYLPDSLEWEVLDNLHHLDDLKVRSEVAARLGKPPHLVSKKLDRLELMGLVRRYVASVQPRYSRVPLKLLLRIRPKNAANYELLARELLCPNPNIVSLYRTAEDYGLLAVVRVRDVPTYRSFIRALYDTGEVLDTHTTLVVDEVVPGVVPYSVRRFQMG
ncbi:MAG: hypothetical protein Kow0069_13880 [Promethearchaeota archaeon]